MASKLHKAAENGDSNLAKQLLSQGTDVDVRGKLKKKKKEESLRFVSSNVSF